MPVTGLKASSLNNLVLNEGAFLVGFDWTAPATAAALETALVAALEDGSTLLGATNGGGTFKAVPETRQIEIDGIRGSVKGATAVDSWDVGLTGTLKELKQSTMAYLAMCATVQSAENLTKITIRGNIEDTDYIPKICWVGSTPYGYMLIGLTNVLNVAGIEMTFEDKNEATIPFEFKAHSTSLTGDAVLPVEIIMLTSTTGGTLDEITVSSAAGTATGYTAITVSGYTPVTGGSYVYKTGSVAPTIAYGATPDYTWMAWDGDDEIAAVTDSIIAIVGVDANGKAVAYGTDTVVSA